MQQAVEENNFTEVVLNRSCDQPILVNFGTSWCGLCKILEPLINRAIPSWHGRLEVVDIDADENMRLANAYKIQNLPTLLVFVDGKVVQRFDRFRNREELQRSLDEILVPDEAVRA
jgi:thioredoxin 1